MAELDVSESRFEQRVLRILGGTMLSLADAMGRLVILTRQTIYWVKSAERRSVFEQMVAVGVDSIPVTTLTALFTGMVLALQTGFSFRKVFNEPIYVGTVVGLSLTKELGPVLTAVVVAGRVGAAIAAELGTMKVTEQIDALYTLGTNPVKYLAVPRFIACLISIPILTMMAIFTGIIGGLIIAVYRLGIPMTVYMNEIKEIGWKECAHGITKSVFFAAIIVIISCYKGFTCEGGAEGVGKSTTSAVVISMVLVLVLDYFLSAILVSFWHRMIQFENVFKAFGPNHVLRGCSLDVKDGETLTIIGGSGTGKSVTLKLMLGLLKPDEGRILVEGKDITPMGEDELSEVQKEFSYVFQGGALFDSMTVGENVAFGLQQLGQHPPDKIREIVKEKLAIVGLQGIEHLKPSELSGGMRKRVAIARSVAMSPKYLFYDEPTTGLDPIMSDVINDLIVDLHQKLGQTGVVITHDMRSAYKISSRIAMLYEGKIIQIDTPDNIKNSTNPVVQQFVTGSAQGPIQMKVRAYE